MGDGVRLLGFVVCDVDFIVNIRVSGKSLGLLGNGVRCGLQLSGCMTCLYTLLNFMLVKISVCAGKVLLCVNTIVLSFKTTVIKA